MCHQEGSSSAEQQHLHTGRCCHNLVWHTARWSTPRQRYLGGNSSQDQEHTGSKQLQTCLASWLERVQWVAAGMSSPAAAQLLRGVAWTAPDECGMLYESSRHLSAPRWVVKHASASSTSAQLAGTPFLMQQHRPVNWYVSSMY
jgi:hypothetical protein